MSQPTDDQAPKPEVKPAEKPADVKPDDALKQAAELLQKARADQLTQCKQQIGAILEKNKAQIVCVHVGGNAPHYDIISR